MKLWLGTAVLAAWVLTAPLRAAEAPAAPVVAVPADVSPSAEPTVQTVTAPKLPDPTPVPTQEKAVERIVVKARDSGAATAAAFWPGFLLHGWGHHVAGDQETFVSLAGGELFGAVMLGFGLAEALGPDIKNESKATSQSIAIAGGVIFVGTWAWDIIDAGAAAKRYNVEHQLGLQPLPGGAQLAYNTRF